MPAHEEAVIPAKAGIQFVGLIALKTNQMHYLDTGVRRYDGSVEMPAPKNSVIPAKAGIQFVGLTALKTNQMHYLDTDVRRYDGRIGG